MASLFQKSGQPIVTNPTTATPGYIGGMNRTAQGYVDQNNRNGFQLNPGVQSAMDAFRQMLTSGTNAITGQPGGVDALMNPYLSHMNPIFDFLRSQASQNANQQATLGGGGGSAFDSSRAALMQGAAESGIDQSQANMNFGAFNDAMSRGLSMAMGGGQGLLNAGEFAQGAPQAWQAANLGLLNGGMGPTGTSQPTNWSPLLTLAGLAMTPFGGGTGLLGMTHAAAGGQ